jgi:GNAT superfamily N-acetyltransferase
VDAFMSCKVVIRAMRPDEALEVACLVRRVFDACVAPCFDEQGRLEFYAYIEPAAFRQRAEVGEGPCWVALDAEERIVGMLAQRGAGHISLFFVEAERQRCGVGRALLQAAISHTRTASPPAPAMTVHASPNALDAYARMGFVATEEEQCVHGIRYVPMRRTLEEEGMSELIIRPARPEDQETLVAIALAAWEPIFAYFRQAQGDELFDALHPDWRAEKARQIRSACAGDYGLRVCVAEREGRTLGFCSYGVRQANLLGEIGNNAVWPDCRGQGIAGRLYAYALHDLREMGARYVVVGTGGDPAHAPARRAYEKAGFDVALPEMRYYRKL